MSLPSSLRRTCSVASMIALLGLFSGCGEGGAGGGGTSDFPEGAAAPPPPAATPDTGAAAKSPNMGSDSGMPDSTQTTP